VAAIFKGVTHQHRHHGKQPEGREFIHQSCPPWSLVKTRTYKVVRLEAGGEKATTLCSMVPGDCGENAKPNDQTNLGVDRDRRHSGIKQTPRADERADEVQTFLGLAGLEGVAQMRS
jgi:hypothetical protein